MDAGFSPTALFAQGEMGCVLSADTSDVFSDVDGQIPASFGHSLARIDDLSVNALHAIQPAAALRPLLGRAPSGAAPGGAIDQGSGSAFIRFDLADDVMPVSFPDGGTFDVMVFGRQGSWIARDVTITPSSSLNIGPLSFTGAAAGVLPVLGDIVGWIAVDRTLTNAEIARLVQYYMAQGAKGLLVPGPELNRDPDFNDASKWATPGGWSVSSGTASISNAEGQFNLRDNSAPVVPGSVHLVTVDISSISGGELVAFENGNNDSINFPAVTGTHTALIRLKSGGNTIAVRPSLGTTVIVNSFSLRELRPEEDW